MFHTCAPPTQPEMTNGERVYIAKLSNQFGCEVRRELDYSILDPYDRKEKKGGYCIIFNVKCDSLNSLNENFQEMKAKGLTIAKDLFCVVLDKPEKINTICLYFTCDTELAKSSKYKTLILDYPTDTLCPKN